MTRQERAQRAQMRRDIATSLMDRGMSRRRARRTARRYVRDMYELAGRREVPYHLRHERGDVH